MPGHARTCSNRAVSDELPGEVDRLGGERRLRRRRRVDRRRRRLHRRAIPQGRGHGRAQVGGDGGAAQGGQVARRRQLDVRRAPLPHQPRLQARWLPTQATGKIRGASSSVQEDKELLGLSCLWIIGKPPPRLSLDFHPGSASRGCDLVSVTL